MPDSLFLNDEFI